LKLSVGFVGFDGTENKRAIPAIYQVKKAEGVKGDMNILLRSPHARAKVMLSKFTRMCDVRAFLTDEKERSAWENAGVEIDGDYRNFFEESNLVFVGTPEGQEAAHVEACLEHGSNTVLMGGAHRIELLNEMAAKGIDIPNKNDYG
jgi:glyceraldehyde-3-phosphate dehydrogenase (NAD(P))